MSGKKKIIESAQATSKPKSVPKSQDLLKKDNRFRPGGLETGRKYSSQK